MNYVFSVNLVLETHVVAINWEARTRHAESMAKNPRKFRVGA